MIIIKVMSINLNNLSIEELQKIKKRRKTKSQEGVF